MIISGKFTHDRHQWMMNIQHDCYENGSIFRHARFYYLKAEAVVGIKTETGKRLLSISDIDHRILQNTHDLIAAQFRRVNDSKLDPQLFTPMSDEQAKDAWLMFYQEEIVRLCIEPEFVRNVCTAVAFPNPDEEGIRAEEALKFFLEERYGMEP